VTCAHLKIGLLNSIDTVFNRAVVQLILSCVYFSRLESNSRLAIGVRLIQSTNFNLGNRGFFTSRLITLASFVTLQLLIDGYSGVFQDVLD